MPIRPEEKRRYPADWARISREIRIDRAHGQCECRGECGGDHQGRCTARNGGITRRGGRVVLTVAHLNHTPEDCRPENLRAMCQACHLRYDRHHHAETRAATRRRQLATLGQGELAVTRALLTLAAVAAVAMCWAADSVGWPLSLPLMILAVALGTAGVMREDGQS
jgi:hypothetical protein